MQMDLMISRYLRWIGVALGSAVFSSCAYAIPWEASSAFDATFEYEAVDDKGGRHPFKIQYDGILNHFKYQTGSARFPDNRRCNYGFKRQLRRSFIGSSEEFSSSFIRKVNIEEMYVPELWVTAVSDFYEFFAVISNGAIAGSVKPVDLLNKVILQNLAKIVGFKRGNNCGEMAGVIAQERKIYFDGLKVAKPVADVDHLIVLIQLLGKHEVKDVQSGQWRRILFVYPSTMQKEHVVAMRPLIDQAWAFNMLSATPPAIMNEWLAKVTEQDWQAKMWEEFGKRGLAEIKLRVEQDRKETQSLIEDSKIALSNMAKVCINQNSTERVPLGPLLVRGRDLFTRCATGCLPTFTESAAAKALDAQQFQVMLTVRRANLTADLDRMAEMERMAPFIGVAAEDAAAIANVAGEITAQGLAWQPPIVPATASSPPPPPPSNVFEGCVSQVLTGLLRACGNGLCQH